jgi:hypothetical protein
MTTAGCEFKKEAERSRCNYVKIKEVLRHTWWIEHENMDRMKVV